MQKTDPRPKAAKNQKNDDSRNKDEFIRVTFNHKELSPNTSSQNSSGTQWSAKEQQKTTEIVYSQLNFLTSFEVVIRLAVFATTQKIYLKVSQNSPNECQAILKLNSTLLEFSQIFFIMVAMLGVLASFIKRFNFLVRFQTALHSSLVVHVVLVLVLLIESSIDH